MGGPTWLRRALLALATVAVVVGPVVGLAYVAQASIARDLEQRSARDRLRTAELASRLVTHYFEDGGRNVAYLAEAEEVRLALRSGDRRTLGTLLAAASKAWPDFTSLLAIDAAGIEIAVAAGGAARDAAGIGQDRSTRDYFTGALASPATYVSQAYLSVAPGAPVLVAVSHAVRDGPVTLGVIAGAIAPQHLTTDITQALDGAAGLAGRQILLVDSAGRIIVSTDPAHAALAAAGLPATSGTLAGEHMTRTTVVGGSERVVTSVPVDGTQWALYVIDDPNVVLAVERGLNRTVGWAAAIMIVAAAMVAAAMVALFAALARRRDQLTASREALEETNADLALASRHKTAFLSSVSHELRTPLNAILGFTDLLDEQLRPAATERQRRYFQNVRTAGEHLLGLIDDVLDLSRIESGRIELKPEEIAIEHLVEPCQANIRRSAADKGITFESAIGDGIVRVDVGRVRQVLYNLGSNAVKFTPAGGRIHCDARLEGTALAIDVSDTGIGIPADRQDKVFGMFQRLNEDRSDAKGTGLGLALSRLLIELHGGTIAFESTVDRGTTFHVRLPGVAAGRGPTSGDQEVTLAHPAR